MIGCLCASTRRAARLLTSLYDAELSGAGLSSSQYEMLTVLKHGEQNGRGVARALALDFTTVSRNLKPLLSAGLVSAHPSDQDARQLRYALTRAGKTRLAKADKLWLRAQSTVAARLQQPVGDMLTNLHVLGNAASVSTASAGR